MYIRLMKASKSLYKGSLSTIILRLLQERDKMYGYEITKRAKELTQGELAITEGALYPALHKLEADGLVSVSVATVGNRQRKYYSLTKTGKKETQHKLAELQSFIEQMQLVLQLQPALKK